MKNLTDKTFIKLLAVLNFLNIYDGVSTATWVTHYGATELNPVIDALLSLGLPTFFIVKILGVFILSLYMWRERYDKIVRWALLIGLIFYGCLALYEFVLSVIMLCIL